MRVFFFGILVFFLTFQTNAQAQDSLEIRDFLNGVDRIELCRLKMSCFTDTIIDFETGNQILEEQCFSRGIIHKDSLQLSKITQKTSLSDEQKKELFDLLSTTSEITINGTCYNPRHGLLFYDKSGEQLGYLEICFECHEVRSIPFFGCRGFDEASYQKLETLFEKYSNF